VNAVANTYISIFRGSTTDAEGDEVESDLPLFSGIPASLIEGRTRQVESGTSGTPRVVLQATMRVDARTDIKRNDRVKDERTQKFWRIEAVAAVGNPAVTPDLRVDLIS
jgi:hypothetical protein